MKPASSIDNKFAYLVLPCREYLRDFRIQVAGFDHVEEIVQEVIPNFFNAMSYATYSLRDYRAEVDLFSDSGDPRDPIENPQRFKDAAMNLFSKVWGDIMRINALDKDGMFPYKFYAFTNDDLIMVHDDVES